MTTSLDVRSQLLEDFRRDLIGPGPGDADLARERLAETPPSRWYLAGFIAPVETEDATDDTDPSTQDEADLDIEPADRADAEAKAADDEEPEAPNSHRRLFPSSVGLTVFVDQAAERIDVEVSWGDYRTEPPLPEALLEPDPPSGAAGGDDAKRPDRPRVDWVRAPKTRSLSLPIEDGRGRETIVPESAAEQYPTGGLVVETHARLFTYRKPDGSTETVRALTVFLVNKRKRPHRFYADVSYAFQARLDILAEDGFKARRDISTYASEDWDLQVADLHYRDLCEWAVGRNAAAAWDPAEDEAGLVTRVWTDALPRAEVERIAPNEDPGLTEQITFGMDALAESATDATRLRASLENLPSLYAQWMVGQRDQLDDLAEAPRRHQTARKLIVEMEVAQARIAAGIEVLANQEFARSAFRFMNLAVATAARKRGFAGPSEGPSWRPFQLAFILLNISGLTDRTHGDREVADLLFFPTGGGKTEAYLGLAAYVIALRRLKASGLLGAGVAVIMRYTLRLLTLDQLSRAAGVVCALELMRTDPANRGARGQPLLGDWPIEIGLWVGSDASPNRLGKRGEADEHTAVGRVRRYKNGRDKRAPAPLKACPWCGTPFTANSFACTPNDQAPTNLEIRCVNTVCDFGTGRALPILTVDEPIYSRLPAFLVATIDKFASLPWVGETGAFFGHVDRFDPARGFFGAAHARGGSYLDNGWSLDPPELIIQDELHLISGPLGTVAGLYETAIDQLASRQVMGRRVRPKIVASTATVRRASDQIEALFDRKTTAIFPPPGLDRRDSFFARTIPSSEDPARLYLGIAAQGRGPKLVFLRALTTLAAAAQAAFERDPPAKGVASPADPYMTAVCYFNALRELGGARRIVEDEVRDRAGRYGSERRRVDPSDHPFADRQVSRILELTSRESTDAVSVAKQRLEYAFGASPDVVDVALATNMISVGLDIVRLGLMIVQGQPKTAAEYIQATSRVGRDHHRPGLIVAVLNLHKPRDRLHFEHFGQFHRTFYRAVEATSVTPWAARALDRALAAVIVSSARHLSSVLSPEAGAADLADDPAVRVAVREAILARAPATAVAGGSDALAALIDETFDDWLSTADEQSEGGSRFVYSARTSPHRLLHMPLDKDIANLTSAHQRFVAGRSMRDVEAAVPIRVVDPYGNRIANTDDSR
jgi:hypothetical protein